MPQNFFAMLSTSSMSCTKASEPDFLPDSRRDRASTSSGRRRCSARRDRHDEHERCPLPPPDSKRSRRALSSLRTGGSTLSSVSRYDMTSVKSSRTLAPRFSGASACLAAAARIFACILRSSPTNSRGCVGSAWSQTDAFLGLGQLETRRRYPVRRRQRLRQLGEPTTAFELVRVAFPKSKNAALRASMAGTRDGDAEQRPRVASRDAASEVNLASGNFEVLRRPP